jgi:NTE family protein
MDTRSSAASWQPRLDHHYTLSGGRVAGTSAGSIAAALLAAGYRSTELRSIVFGPQISRFTDMSWLSKIPLVGRPLDMTVGLLTQLGLFKGDYFLQYLRELLLDKGVSTFKDLIDPERKCDPNPRYRYRAHFVASDITRGRMLVLPDDITVERYGFKPDDLEVAVAVRMSISVPFFFRPVVLTGRNGVKTYLVDGGLLSNFPIDIFDDPNHPEARRSLTVGLRINRAQYHNIDYPFKAARALYALASTALQARDISAADREIDTLKWARAVQIDTSAVSVLNFNLSPLQKENLYNEGYEAMSRGIDTFLAGAEATQRASMTALLARRSLLAARGQRPCKPL